MAVFETIQDHEQVLFCHHEESGLKAIIVIHDTTLGPALGGCRMYPYPTEEEALQDALRLARGMTFKCAASDVDFGGGKAVIIGDPQQDKSPELFRAFGRFVESLNGRFYTGTDMGTTTEDFVHAAKETSCIVGLPLEHGGSGDSSVPTALGVLEGIRASARHLWNTESLEGRTFAVQGLGKVGYKLVHLLWQHGAKVVAADVDEASLSALREAAGEQKYPLEIVAPHEIFEVDMDMFVPCAVGGVINEETIGRLRCQAIVGSANNQLAGERDGELLHSRGILYAPDFVVNAGGLIQVADELYGSNHERVMKKTKSIYNMTFDIFEYSSRMNVPTMQAADELAEEKIRKMKDVNSIFVNNRVSKWKLRTTY